MLVITIRNSTMSWLPIGIASKYNCDYVESYNKHLAKNADMCELIWGAPGLNRGYRYIKLLYSHIGETSISVFFNQISVWPDI